MLTNPLYAGYWFNPLTGDWTPNNHPAIVPAEHFWYAFNRLSPFLLDGSPNPDCVQPSSNRNSNNLQDADGLFHGLLVIGNDQWRINRRVMRCRGKKELYYQVADMSQPSNPVYLLHIRAQELDTDLLPILIQKLKDTKELEGYRQYGEQLKAQQAAQNANLERLLAENEAELCATEIRIDTLTEPTLLLKQQDKYKLLLSRNAALKQQLAENSQPQSNRKRRVLSYYELIERLGPHFERMEPADKRVLIESTIDTIFLDILSSSFLLLRINWFAWPEQTFLYRREHVAAGTWSDEEIATLKRLWPTATPEELLQALPTRTWSGIRRTRQVLKLPGRWSRWEPIMLPDWAKHGYAVVDLPVLDRYRLLLDCPKLTEINNLSSVDETQWSLFSPKTGRS